MRIAQYEYSEKIGQGSFGIIYKGVNVKTGEKVVVKTEPYDIEYSSLKHESTIMNMLYSKSCRSIPPTYWYGVNFPTKERIMILPMYQETLEQFMLKTNKRNSVSNEYCGNIMRSAIRVLSHIHGRYVVHRDIKPANWMLNNQELILIDFGMASFYVDSSTDHLPPVSSPKSSIIGTPKYASWNIHCGEEYSRRDDLMSLVYIGLFIVYGENLWPIPSAITESVGGCENHYRMNPVNQWFKLNKELPMILEIVTEKWPELAEFAKLAYATEFKDIPDYEAMEELFCPIKTI